jgi:Dyp-type peroxidase family
MPAADALTLPVEDIQGWVVRGYHFPFAVHLFLTFADAAAGRAWLRAVADRITTAAPWPGGRKPSCTFNLAFSFAGLQQLGLGPADLAAFPGEFREGMAVRATLLGDAGASAADAWEIGRADQPMHALVSLHGLTEDALTQQLKNLRGAFGAGVVEQFAQPTAVLPGEVEHFGYRDGISQPPIEGAGVPVSPGHGAPLPGGGWRPVKAGEFILGYPDEAGLISPLPSRLMRNGSFLVWRKLRQHVSLFRQFLTQTAQQHFGDDSPATVERVAAKLMGRWRSGAALELAPDHDVAALIDDWEHNNDFRFGQDPVGDVCPRGAHIRRANPRDALDGQDVAVHRHRMLRRGMPYGDWLPNGADDQDPGRGLVFIAINADIHRQFEFVQMNWINHGDFAGLGGNDRDPVTGPNDLPDSGSFLLPGAMPPFLFQLPRVVTTRGGAYFFVPGVAALRLLAGM